MAKLKTINTDGNYHNLDAYDKVINYITRPDKAIHQYIGMIHLDPANPANSMHQTAQLARRKSKVQLRHFIISFHPLEPVTPEIALQIGIAIIEYLGREYEAICAVHEDKPHLHIHVVCNAVNKNDGSKYNGTRMVFNQFRNFIKSVLQQYGIFELCYVSNKPQ